jgi:hypothetical protein
LEYEESLQQQRLQFLMFNRNWGCYLLLKRITAAMSSNVMDISATTGTPQTRTAASPPYRYAAPSSASITNPGRYLLEGQLGRYDGTSRFSRRPFPVSYLRLRWLAYPAKPS